MTRPATRTGPSRPTAPRCAGAPRRRHAVPVDRSAGAQRAQQGCAHRVPQAGPGSPGEPQYQIELAKRLYRGGKQKEAMKVLERCGQRFPRDASVHSALADLYERWGDYQRAMAGPQVLVRIEPREPSHLINLGEQLCRKGKKRQAIETWKRLLQVIPKRHEALRQAGRDLWPARDDARPSPLPQGDQAQAQAACPTSRGLALLFERKKRTTDALRAWDRLSDAGHGARSKGAVQREARTHIIDDPPPHLPAPARASGSSAGLPRRDPQARVGVLPRRGPLKWGSWRRPPRPTGGCWSRTRTTSRR